jgi:hypothetical protein
LNAFGHQDGFPVQDRVALTDLAQCPVNPLLYVVPFIGCLLQNPAQVTAKDFVTGSLVMHGQRGHHRKASAFDQFLSATAPSNRQIVGKWGLAEKVNAQAVTIRPAFEILGPDIGLPPG